MWRRCGDNCKTTTIWLSWALNITIYDNIDILPIPILVPPSPFSLPSLPTHTPTPDAAEPPQEVMDGRSSVDRFQGAHLHKWYIHIAWCIYVLYIPSHAASSYQPHLDCIYPCSQTTSSLAPRLCLASSQTTSSLVPRPHLASFPDHI